jgi:hypothetical protein
MLCIPRTTNSFRRVQVRGSLAGLRNGVRAGGSENSWDTLASLQRRSAISNAIAAFGAIGETPRSLDDVRCMRRAGNNFYKCEKCRQMVDMRQLDDVLFHEDHVQRPDI